MSYLFKDYIKWRREMRHVKLKPMKTIVQRAQERKPSALDAGNAIVDNIRGWLSKLDTETTGRSYDQMRMQEMFLSGVTRNIYAKAYEMNQKAIMRRNGWDSLTPYVAVMTPRRFGKSWALAAFIAALALEMPSIVIAIFSTGGRASGKQDGLLQHIKRNLQGFGINNFKVDNNEHLYFEIKGNLRQIKAFPAGRDRYAPANFPLPGILLASKARGWCYTYRFLMRIISFLSALGMMRSSPSRTTKFPGPLYMTRSSMIVSAFMNTSRLFPRNTKTCGVTQPNKAAWLSFSSLMTTLRFARFHTCSPRQPVVTM